MTATKIESIVLAFEARTASEAVDYVVLHLDAFPSDVALLANSRGGFASLIVPLPHVAAATVRHTKELSLFALPSLEYARGEQTWQGAAAVIECRDPALLQAFSGMVASIVSRLAAPARVTWDIVSMLFAEWERLFGRRTTLSSDEELGLWAELWWLTRTNALTALLQGWRGPERAPVDFFINACGFEIKAGRRRGSHIVSHSQVDTPVGDASSYFVSMLVLPDPVRGRTLADLVNTLAQRVEFPGMFEEKLAAAGFLRSDEHLYERRLVVLERPSFYVASDVPRVRSADPGVSEVRYRVQLPLERTIDIVGLVTVAVALGVDLSEDVYPCA